MSADDFETQYEHNPFYARDAYDAQMLAAEELRRRNMISTNAGIPGTSYSANRIYQSDNTSRFIPDLTQLDPAWLRKLQHQLQTPEERDMAEWSNTDAQEIARDILREEKKEGLREKVTAAVAGYREMLAEAHCGSVFSFMKTNEKGDHYWYAAIKNGGKWYTTAQSPRVLDDDDAFIEWLVYLQAYESEATELTSGAARKALELGPIDTTAS